MNTIAEIETAIARLPEPDVAELAAWLGKFRAQRDVHRPVKAWLERARGVSRPEVTTAEVMALTRGEE